MRRSISPKALFYVALGDFYVQKPADSDAFSKRLKYVILKNAIGREGESRNYVIKQIQKG